MVVNENHCCRAPADRRFEDLARIDDRATEPTDSNLLNSEHVIPGAEQHHLEVLAVQVPVPQIRSYARRDVGRRSDRGRRAAGAG